MVIWSVVTAVLLGTFEIMYINKTEGMFSALKICRISSLHSSKPSAEAKRGTVDFILTLGCFSGYGMLTGKSSWNIQSEHLMRLQMDPLKEISLGLQQISQHKWQVCGVTGQSSNLNYYCWHSGELLVRFLWWDREDGDHSKQKPADKRLCLCPCWRGQGFYSFYVNLSSVFGQWLEEVTWMRDRERRTNIKRA